MPELGALAALNPEPEDLLVALHVDAEGEVDVLVLHEPAVAPLHDEGVQEDDRVDGIERPVLPCLDLVEDAVGHPRDQVGRNLDRVHLLQLGLDVADAHAARVHRDDLLIEAGHARLVLPHQLGLKRAVPVPWDANRDFTLLALEHLPLEPFRLLPEEAVPERSPFS